MFGKRLLASAFGLLALTAAASAQTKDTIVAGLAILSIVNY